MKLKENGELENATIEAGRATQLPASQCCRDALHTHVAVIPCGTALMMKERRDDWSGASPVFNSLHANVSVVLATQEKTSARARVCARINRIERRSEHLRWCCCT